MTETDSDVRVQEIRYEANAYANVRLARGNLRIQSRAYSTETEWNKKRSSQKARIGRINAKLSSQS